MKTVRTIASLRENLLAWRQFDETIALVPTMGNLHQGHLSLVELARERADRVVVTVFVNPTQFSPGEDYATYPRTLEDDRRKLTRADVDLLFSPDVDEMYPGGERSGAAVSIPDLSRILCGEFRPGHFDGVASVVTRLFNIVRPDLAIFGQKDYQQLVIIRKLNDDLHLGIEIVAGPTVREADGLALSSRNQYLDGEGRARAPALYAALLACRDRLLAGERQFAALANDGHQTLVTAGLRPDYFAIREATGLGPAVSSTRHLVVMAAAHLGRARLIDNVLVDL